MTKNNFTRKNLIRKIYRNVGFSKNFSSKIIDNFFELLISAIIISNKIKTKTKKVKVDGKKVKKTEETYDFEQLSGNKIRPGLFYFIDTGDAAGAIYQYTGEGAIRNWNDVLSAETEGTWKVYAQ